MHFFRSPIICLAEGLPEIRRITIIGHLDRADVQIRGILPILYMYLYMKKRPKSLCVPCAFGMSERYRAARSYSKQLYI